MSPGGPHIHGVRGVCREAHRQVTVIENKMVRSSKKKRGGSQGRQRLSTTRQRKGRFDEASSGHSGEATLPAWGGGGLGLGCRR